MGKIEQVLSTNQSIAFGFQKNTAQAIVHQKEIILNLHLENNLCSRKLPI